MHLIRLATQSTINLDCLALRLFLPIFLLSFESSSAFLLFKIISQRCCASILVFATLRSRFAIFHFAVSWASSARWRNLFAFGRPFAWLPLSMTEVATLLKLSTLLQGEPALEAPLARELTDARPGDLWEAEEDGMFLVTLLISFWAFVVAFFVFDFTYPRVLDRKRSGCSCTPNERL